MKFMSKSASFVIQNFQIGSSSLTLDLLPYIEAVQNKALNDFIPLRRHLLSLVEGVNGPLLWPAVVNNLFKDNPEIIPSLIEHPLYRIMINSFVEIVKNSIDEIIQGYLETHIHQMQLNIEMMYNQYSQNLTIILSDNGRGFSSDFLKKIATPDLRKSYIEMDIDDLEIEEAKKIKLVKKELDSALGPILLGGKNRGLRVLLSKVELGSYLNNNSYVSQPQLMAKIATVSFKNKQIGTGVFITLCMSKELVAKKTDYPLNAEVGTEQYSIIRLNTHPEHLTSLELKAILNNNTGYIFFENSIFYCDLIDYIPKKLEINSIYAFKIIEMCPKCNSYSLARPEQLNEIFQATGHRPGEAVMILPASFLKRKIFNSSPRGIEYSFSPRTEANGEEKIHFPTHSNSFFKAVPIAVSQQNLNSLVDVPNHDCNNLDLSFHQELFFNKTNNPISHSDSLIPSLITK